MSVQRSIERVAHARAVADAPVEALLERSEELARRWVATLILASPLAEIAQIPLENLARSAPALCQALVRALASDESLERLACGDSERVALAPLPDLASRHGMVVADLELLRSILWEATIAELREPSVRLVADLADRLSCVVATALATTLGARRDGASTAVASGVAPQGFGRARVLYGSPRDAPGGGAALVDELAEEPRPLAVDDDSAETLVDARAPATPVAERGRGFGPAPAPAGAPSPGGGPSRTMPRARPWDTPLSDESTVRIRRGPGARVDERG
ncbi:MAG TPA: hypothetical protein VGX69_04825 [Solirubrobacteraceae bacterium]|jgi:hypothetical protein|nr:hypothetical protein [Solirubrobacteraceae bacterium]